MATTGWWNDVIQVLLHKTMKSRDRDSTRTVYTPAHNYSGVMETIIEDSGFLASRAGWMWILFFPL